ncbi:hypothetical protein ABZ027_06645 [Streptomyces sp. NPDC006332]
MHQDPGFGQQQCDCAPSAAYGILLLAILIVFTGPPPTPAA